MADATSFLLLGAARPASIPFDMSVAVDILGDLPGGQLVRKGLADLASGRTSEESLLILIGAPRLRRLGIAVPETETTDPEIQLYTLLSADSPDSAHSRYNALIRLLVSFERAVESAG